MPDATTPYYFVPTRVVGPDGGAVPVDIGSATLSVTANGVEIKNDVGNPIPASGIQAITTASFTRPADTTAYAAQDVVSNSTSAPTLLTFSGAGRAVGGTGLILSARHMKNSTSTSGATYRLVLYKVSTITPINDNSPFTMLYANRANRIGFIDFSHTAAGTGSDSTAALTTFVNLPFVCDAAATAIYGILTVTSAYTPTSAEQHFIELAITQN
jgi:hypothetical protein